MRLVAVVLGVVLLAAPAFADTLLDTFESTLENFGPVGDGVILTGVFGKGPTPCVCRGTNLANPVGNLSFIRDGVDTVSFRATCVLRSYNAATGTPTGQPDFCGDFEALGK